MMNRILDYERKLHILRQIMSDKAKRSRWVNTGVNVMTVAVSSLLTFIGFMGLEKLRVRLEPYIGVSAGGLEFLFNLLVFCVFLLVVFHLVFRFGAKQADAERAIVQLTHLINECDELRAVAGTGQTIPPPRIELVRQKYDMLLQVIPSNTDRQWKRARKHFREKEEIKERYDNSLSELFEGTAQRQLLEGIVRGSPITMEILQTLRALDPKLYLGGGIIRNLVWDFLHLHKHPTPIEDVDVVYSDSLSATRAHDKALEAELTKRVANLTWSVKNQARMHIPNDELPYDSFVDAISKWPETATAMAVRLKEDGGLDVVIPHGLTDLFRLLVVPTPHFRNRLDRYRERLKEKNWQKRWPRLRFIDDA